MRAKNFKGAKCVKMKLKKCEEVIRTYDNIQTAYAELLDKNEMIKEIQCNVPLDSTEEGEFTTDFLCTKTNGDRMVRECVFRKKLSLPRTCKLLDLSREYWRRRGIEDWGILIFEDANASVSHTSLSCSRAPSSSVVAKHLAVLNCPIISIMLIFFHDVRSGIYRSYMVTTRPTV